MVSGLPYLAKNSINLETTIAADETSKISGHFEAKYKTTKNNKSHYKQQQCQCELAP